MTHLFSDYIQSIIVWLQIHPYWALFLAFMVSFSESMAIIGSLIPGSITMTAIGMLAGSGVMRIDLTLLAAILGAVGGDSLSYLIGYVYSDSLNSIWPFRKYPSALTYGKQYFANHGGKSVLIGRFVGPLRSLIPLIAGMMHMNQWSFFIANVISAIGWSLLYVVPGILIGSAGSELSPESATRLFALVLVALAALWLLTMAIRKLLIQTNAFLRKQCHIFWVWAGKHPYLANSISRLTPKHETHHYQTMLLYLAVIACLALSGLLIALAINGTLNHTINQPVSLFFQSLRIHAFDVFFIVLACFTSTTTLIALAIGVLIIALYCRDHYSVYYWLSLITSSGLLTYLAYYCGENQESWLPIELMIASALFPALLCYLNNYQKNNITRILSISLLIILVINGIGLLYLGDYWLTDVLCAYSVGLSICLIHWILYRRKEIPYQGTILAFLISIIIIIFTGVTLLLNYTQVTQNHQPYVAQYVFTDKAWWNQQKPLLPTYRTNRIGKPVSLFNIQYAGSLSHLEATLLSKGWRLEKESLLKSLLNHVDSTQSQQDTPLMAKLYLNRKPILVMTFEPNNGDAKQIIRLWRSNYHLKHFRQPIWLGTVNPYLINDTNHTNHSQNTTSLQYISKALLLFSQRITKLDVPLPTSIPAIYQPTVLLIKEPLIIKTAAPDENTP